jgi:hypothetical protein
MEYLSYYKISILFLIILVYSQYAKSYFENVLK